MLSTNFMSCFHNPLGLINDGCKSISIKPSTNGPLLWRTLTLCTPGVFKCQSSLAVHEASPIYAGMEIYLLHFWILESLTDQGKGKSVSCKKWNKISYTIANHSTIQCGVCVVSGIYRQTSSVFRAQLCFKVVSPNIITFVAGISP